MKTKINLLWMTLLVISCSTLGRSEQSILDYVRYQTGSPKLVIEFADIQTIRHSVGDSIRILQEIFETDVKEKEEKIATLEKTIKETETALASVSKKSMEHQLYSFLLTDAQRQNKHWKERVVTNGKSRYNGRDTSELIAVVVNCQMTSLINPILKAKQTKEGTFLLSPDESKCIKQLK